MKTKLQIVTDIFKLSSSRYKSIIGCGFGKKIFAQVVEVHISKDGSFIKGLQQELINSIKTVCVSACSFINSTIHVNCQVFYLQCTSVEVSQRNTAVFSILHSLKRLITSKRNFDRTKLQQLC